MTGFPLACAVRGCGRPLLPVPGGLGCEAGHRFDRAREGFVTLLQPRDRRSPRAGDPPEATSARARFRGSGALDALARALEAMAAPFLAPGARVLDVGCGDGFWLARLAAGRALATCGIDLSRGAIRSAARAHPSATWVVANADRGLPVPDRSVDLALSLHARLPEAELRRVLRPEGRLIVAVPADDDLVELREAVQGDGTRRDRAARVVRDLEGWVLEERRSVRDRRLLSGAVLRDALALTYRGARRSERERAGAIEALTVTLSADLLLLRAGSGAGEPGPDRPDPGGGGPTRPG